MAAIFQDGRHLIGAVKWYSGLFGDTIMKIGMSSLWWSLDNKQLTATFFKMSDTLEEQLDLRNHLVGDTSMKIGMSCLKGLFGKKLPTATWNFKMTAFFSKITTTYMEQFSDIIV